MNRCRSVIRMLLIMFLALNIAVLGPVMLNSQVKASLNRVPAYMAVHETDDPLVPADPPPKRHDVYDLKVRLRDLGLYDGFLDEIYDEGAVLAVQQLQRIFWLEPNGVVCKSTWRALAYGVTRSQSPAAGPRPDGAVRIEVDTEKLELAVYVGETQWKTYPVAAGKWTTLSPVGEWKIIDKGYEQGGAFGSRWMALDVPWGGYGIHGTNRPWSIGSYASGGCIRMHNEDVEELYDMVAIGTRVTVRGPRPYLNLNQPIRQGTSGPEVVVLQERLRDMGFDAGPCDGRYWEKTAASVKELKEVFGLGSGTGAAVDVLAFLGLRGP